jgi:hypothetical protein
MPNGSRTAPRPVWLPPDSAPHDHSNKSHHRSAGVVERGLLAVAATALCLVGFASKTEDAGQLTSLVFASFARLPEYGALLFFGSALIGLGIWARRHSR